MSHVQEDEWCLLHLASGRALMGLTEIEARAAVMAIGPNESSWMVWKSPWEEWRRLDRVYELHEPLLRTLNEQPPALPDSEEEETRLKGVDPDGDGPQGLAKALPGDKDHGGGAESEPILQLENVGFEEGSQGAFVVRKARRFNKRYEIAVMLNNKVFNTHSMDISVGGIRLEDELPDWVSGYFKIRIKKPGVKQIIELSACLLDGDGPPDRFRVNILPLQNSADETNLEIWLAA